MLGQAQSLLHRPKWAMASSTPVQAPAGTSSKASASEQQASWNNNADNLNAIAASTLMYGIDALEIAGVSPGDKMLDVATGTGHLALYAAAKKSATVDAIDFASENIAMLQHSLQERPLPVTGHVMDGQQLEFGDDQFDIVSSCFGVFLFPDYMQGVKEMFRVAKPGGRSAVVAWAESHRAMMRPWMQLLETHFPEVLPLSMPPGVTRMSDMDGMKAVLEAGGFEDVKVSEVAHSVKVPNPEAFANIFSQNPVVGETLKELAPERRSDIGPKFVQLLKSEYMQDGVITFDAFAVIGCGTKPKN